MASHQQAGLALFTLAQVVYSCPFLPLSSPLRLLPPLLSILISFALPVVIYFPDLYLSTTNKLGYHAPPLLLFLFCLPDPLPANPSPFFSHPFIHQPRLLLQPLTYEMLCQSERWCLPRRICVWLGRCLCSGCVCVEELCSCLVVLHCCLLRPWPWQVAGPWQVEDRYVCVRRCVCVCVCITYKTNNRLWKSLVKINQH